MKIRKSLKILLLTGCFVCAFTALENINIKADNVNTQDDVIIKAASLNTNKILVVPKKKSQLSVSATGNSNNSNSSTNSNAEKNISRGTVNTNSISGGNDSAVGIAYSLIGKPYVWGASGPKAFDCSGLVMYVFGKCGVSLPHYTGSQFSMGSSVSQSNLRPGDAVFFNTYGSVSHVGIYIGNGQFIHAPSTGYTVTISSLSDGYYSSRYAGARRYK